MKMRFLLGIFLIVAAPSVADFSRSDMSYRFEYSVSRQELNKFVGPLIQSGALNRRAFSGEYRYGVPIWYSMSLSNPSVSMLPAQQMASLEVDMLFKVIVFGSTYDSETNRITLKLQLLSESSGNSARHKLCALPLEPADAAGVRAEIRDGINEVLADTAKPVCLDLTFFGRVFPGISTDVASESLAPRIEAERITFGFKIKHFQILNKAASVDYDGDGRSDASVTNTSSGQWLIDLAINGFNSAGPADLAPTLWTSGADSAAHGDYDGDGIADIAFFRQDGYWMIDKGANGFNGPDMWVNTQWAYSGRVPVPADYDGDGVTDLAVISRDGYGSFWSIDFSANGFDGPDVDIPMNIGSGYHAVPADYDGDGKADLAFKDDVTGQWMIDYRVDGYGFWNHVYTGWGGANFLPAPADFDGDGKADLAVVENGGYAGWWIDYAADGFQNGYFNAEWVYGGVGTVALIPAPSDYDGDGKADPAGKTEWGTWVIDYSSNGFGGTDEWLEGWGGLEYKPLHKPAASNTGINASRSAYNLAFALPRDSRVTVTAFTLEGKRAANLYDGRLKEGANSIGWEKGDLVAKGMKRGVYLITIQADGFKTSKRMMFSE